MAGFQDFKGIWWVRKDKPYNGEDPEHKIAIGGVPPAAVTVICIDDYTPGKHPFPPEGSCSYEEATKDTPNRIRVPGDTGNFYITLNEDANEITCGPMSSDGTGPGSLTATDNPGGYAPRR